MSLTAHPYIVVAEQQWKQESLSGANLATRRTRGPRKRLGWHLPRPLGARLGTPLDLSKAP